MPIYEYRCASCGHELEALQKLADAPLTVCPQCNATTLTKLVSAAGFQLKGTGWYVTDFKGGAKSGSKSKDTSTDSTSDDGKGADKAEPAKESTTADSSKTSTNAETKSESNKAGTPSSSSGSTD
jgi:putative FmdB family regulatory protein